MKSFFDFMSEIKSSDLALAIGAPMGAGPFCGFGSAVINEGQLNVYPYPTYTNDRANRIKDRVVAHSFHQPNSTEGNKINFGCISRDSQIYINTDSVLQVPIQGEKSTFNEVFLFAVHTKVEDPIENPVNFVAYWNNSSISFYRLHKESEDIYYPLTSSSRTPVLSDHDVINDSKFTYEYLESAVRSCCPSYDTGYQTNMVLIGIYGTGINAITGLDESFAIVPYNSVWPTQIPYNRTLHSAFMESIQSIESKLAGINQTVVEYMENELAKIKEEVAKQTAMALLPVGSIILWEGETIPNGWVEYTKAQGKYIMGYKEGGIQVSNKTVLGNVGDMYNPANPYHLILGPKDIPAHYHGVGLVGGKIGDNAKTRCQPSSYTDRDTGINGPYGGSVGLHEGTALTSRNFSDAENYQEEVSTEVKLANIPPTVTLRYIQKVS
jgi:hypothetical protein